MRIEFKFKNVGPGVATLFQAYFERLILFTLLLQSKCPYSNNFVLFYEIQEKKIDPEF